MATMQAAQKLIGVNVLRREAMTDAVRHGRALNDVDERSVRLEIAAALRITESEAAGILALGEALVEQFPTVLDSFASARMTERHARLLVESLQELEPEFHEQVLSTAIELAETEPVGAFRRRLRALIDTVRAKTLTERHEDAVQRRRVVLQPDHDAMTWVMMLMPAVEAHAIWDKATRIAKVILTQEGETRTLDQIRADVIADLLIDGRTDLHPAEARGIPCDRRGDCTRPHAARSGAARRRACSGGGSRADPGRARPRTGRGSGGVDAGPHPSRDRDGPLRRTASIFAAAGPAQAGEVESRSLYGSRMRGAGIPLRNRPSHRMGARGTDPAREPESVLQRASHRQTPRWVDCARRRGKLRRGRMDLSHRSAVHRPAGTASACIPDAA